MGIVAALFTVFLLFTASSDDWERVDGMQYTYHHIEDAATFRHTCGPKLGCAVPDIANRRCDIYLSLNAQPETVAHERMTCHGWRHPGDTEDIEHAYRHTNDWYMPEKTAALIKRVNANG